MRAFLILAFALVATFSIAQTPAVKPAWLQGHQGPRIGFGLASRTGGQVAGGGTNLLLAPMVGWFFEAPVHPQVSIMPEILYMTKGYNSRNQAQGARYRTTLRYLEIPLGIKVSTSKDTDGMYLIFGPSMGYFLKGRDQTWTNGQETAERTYTSLPSPQGRFQTSAFAGFGMEGDKWSFDVRTQASFQAFNKYQTGGQNVNYSLTFAYRIAGKKPPPPETEE